MGIEGEWVVPRGDARCVRGKKEVLGGVFLKKKLHTPPYAKPKAEIRK